MTKEVVKFWTGGRNDSAACISGWRQDNIVVVLSAEDDALSQQQFNRAVQAEYPDCTFTFEHECGHWKAWC